MKIFFLIILFLGCCTYLFLKHKTSMAEGQYSMKLMSSAFKNGDTLPILYTCDGKNINPPLEWSNVPQETKSFVLIMEDPDAPATKPEPWVHWIIFNIPVSINKIEENSDSAKLEGAKHGFTNSGKTKYHGACPPDAKHRYIFTLYAVDRMINLPEGASKNEIMKAMSGHIVEKAELMATYERI